MNSPHDDKSKERRRRARSSNSSCALGSDKCLPGGCLFPAFHCARAYLRALRHLASDCYVVPLVRLVKGLLAEPTIFPRYRRGKAEGLSGGLSGAGYFH
jgi:hypothetical protein